MTSKEIVEGILPLNEVQRLNWLITLGWEMTVSARAGYPNSTLVEDKLSYLIAFNEIQHQISNFMRHSSGKAIGRSKISWRGFAKKLLHLA
jgi:hypothetical protein